MICDACFRSFASLCMKKASKNFNDLHFSDWFQSDGIILKWTFKNLDGEAWTGWSWLRIGTGGGHL